MSTEVMQMPMHSEDYVVKFAYKAGSPTAPNLPLALTRKSWAKYQKATEENPEKEVLVETTTGQKLRLRRADCGSGCRCALEWRVP